MLHIRPLSRLDISASISITQKPSRPGHIFRAISHSWESPLPTYCFSEAGDTTSCRVPSSYGYTPCFVLRKLGTLFQAKNAKFEEVMARLERAFSPQQIARLLLWVSANRAHISKLPLLPKEMLQQQEQ